MPPQASDTDDQRPVINGYDASITDSIQPICAALAARVNAFLASEAPTPILKQVQAQTRIALGVIDEALEKYR
jgi:FAD synthetase